MIGERERERVCKYVQPMMESLPERSDYRWERLDGCGVIECERGEDLSASKLKASDR